MQIPETYSNTYSKYLPGKKIRIVLLLLIIAIIAYFIVIPIVAKIKKDGLPPAKPLSFNIVLPSGDPTTRDSDNDGIVDWQEIAVGLNPNKAATSPGIADGQVFNALKNQLGTDAFNQAISESTITDQLSFTIAHSIEQAATVPGTTVSQSLSQASVNEILNYIDSQKKTYTVYTSDDLTIVEDSLKTNQSYAASMQTLLKDSAATDTLLADIRAYATGTGSGEKVLVAKTAMNTAINKMKAMRVPSAASDLHLKILNSLQGFYQATDTVAPKNTDEVTRFGSLAILQDYAIQLATSVGKLPIYFSIALNTNSYIR